MSTTFRPTNPLKGLAAMHEGQSIWEMLHKPEIRGAMDGAIRCGCPPIRAIDHKLAELFSGRPENTAYVQLAGEMVAQACEAMGARRTGRRARFAGRFAHNGMLFSF